MDRIPYHLLDGASLDLGITDSTTQTGLAVAAPVWVSTTSPADLALANNEQNTYWAAGEVDPGSNDTFAYRLTLPEPYDINSYFAAAGGDPHSAYGDTCEVWYRQDAGAWTKWVEHGGFWLADGTQWVSGKVTPATPITNVVQVAVTLTQNSAACRLISLHVYGTPTNATDRLRLWDPTLDQALPSLEFGSVSPSEVKTLQFRIRNTHTKAANGVVLSGSDVTGDMADGMAFSADGTTFTATLDIGNIAAGATSGVLHARRTVPASPTFGHQMAYMSALPTSWS